MAKPDWLSIEEITRLWTAETGHDASAFRKDLEAWFDEFVKQPPKPDSLLSAGHADKTNRLMGMLGARHLNRSTFEAYCMERGHPMPRFWSGGRAAVPPADRSTGRAPIAPSSDSRPSPSGDAPSPGAAESDPDLAAFQKQIETLSERLQTSHIDIPNFGAPSSGAPSSGAPSSGAPSSGAPSSGAPSSGGPSSGGPSSDDRPDLSEQPGETEPGVSDRQELIEQAAAAAAEARDLKAQLEAAEQRIRDLGREKEGVRHAPAGLGFPEGSVEPDANWQEADASARPSRQALVGYRGPDAAGHALRQKSQRRTSRVRTVLAVGLAVPFVGLLLWGAETMFELAHKEPLSPGLETADPLAASGPQGDSAGQAPAAFEERAGQTQPETADRPPDGQVDRDGDAARGEIARLNAALETSKLVVARLQAELALARQQAEAARRATPSGTGAASDASGERQRLDAMLVATEASARAVALQKTLEANRKQTAELTKALAAAKAEGIELAAAAQQAEKRVASAEASAQAVQAEAEKLAASAEASAQAVQAEAEKQAANAEEAAQAARAEAEKRAAAEAATADAKKDAAEARDEAARLRESLQEVQDQARAERENLTLAATVSAARVAALHRDLEAARQALADGTRASEATAADLSSLSSELQQAEERAAEAEERAAQAEERVADAETAQETAETSAAEARKSLAEAEQKAAALAEQVDSSIDLATNIDKSLAGARAETNRLRRENARLADELAAANSEVSRLDAAVQLAEGRAEAGRQDLSLAATASSARVAELERELEAARRQITSLSEAAGSARDEAARLREELSARQQEAAAVSVTAADAFPPNVSAGQGIEPDPGPQGTADVGETKIEELLASAEASPEPGAAPAVAPGDSQAPAPEAASATGDPEQIAAFAPTQVVSEADFPNNTVATDDLLLEPGDHVGREVVVTGSVVWLLWRYRLQSDSGPGSLVIDVDGLQSTDQTVLKKAMDEVGLLGQVRARIKGIIQRRGDTSYHLAASEVVLVE